MRAVTTTRPTAATYAEAIETALAHVQPPAPTRVALAAASGSVLREAIHADRDQPPFDRAQMDGYAVRVGEVRIGAAMPVVGSVAAGEPGDVAMPPGACVAIATGAPVPPGADAVIQHELSDRAEPVRFSATVPRGHAIHPQGADARRGDVVLPAGVRLESRHLAIAAAVGATTPLVVAPPRVAILTSGDEIVDPDSPEGQAPAPHQVRNSNATLLRALLPALGARPGTVAHLSDDADRTVAAVRDALDSHALIVTVGGISAGVRDRFVGAIDALGLRTVVRRVRLQPGGPLTVAVDERSGSLMLGLPGNPVSALVCAHLFAWPMIRRLGGDDPALPWLKSTLAAPARTRADRQAFRPAMIDEHERVTIPTWAGSGDLIHTARTQGIVELPMSEGEAAAGTSVRFLRWCG